MAINSEVVIGWLSCNVVDSAPISLSLLSARRRQSRFIAGRCWDYALYGDGCRMRSTLMPIYRLVLFATYGGCPTLMLMSASDNCVYLAHSYHWSYLILLIIYLLRSCSYCILNGCTTINSVLSGITDSSLPKSASWRSLESSFPLTGTSTCQCGCGVKYEQGSLKPLQNERKYKRRGGWCYFPYSFQQNTK